MLDNKNVIPFRRRVEYGAESLNNIIEEIARTPVEPGLLKLMDVQIQPSKNKNGGEIRICAHCRERFIYIRGMSSPKLQYHCSMPCRHDDYEERGDNL